MQTGIGKRDEHLRSADFFDVDGVPADRPSTVHGGWRRTGRTPCSYDGHADRQGRRAPLIDLQTMATVLDDGAVADRRRTPSSTATTSASTATCSGMIGDTTRIERDAVFAPQEQPPS